MSDYKSFMESANKMADMAGEIALKYFRSQFDMQEKDDKTPVTVTDREIEERMRAYLVRHHPDHGVIGEEFGTDRPDAEFVWVIDPIDGTKAFATGKPLFGTIIGLAHEGRPIAGVIDQAFTKERWIGVENEGTTHNGQPVRVALRRNFDEVRFYTAAPEMFHGETFPHFERLRTSVKWTLYGCDCYAYGLLSMGQIDLVMEQFLGLHDIIGLVPIIKAAGGYVSDWAGHDITLQSGNRIIAASNKEIAAKALSIINGPA